MLIEISIISDLQELEKKLTLFYPYIEAEKQNMEIILGKNITQNIFMLMNKFIRHKIKEKEWLSKLNINQQEMKDMFFWLKDIILFYFTCCSKTYPKTIIQKISNLK
ncbi:MAG: hypothetical protein H9Q65_04625 [Spiroplasma ixodetis]|nr:hypothetical protein [Spiroplasma ixodetis]MBP1528507.1 hypothetical protein [Spiroplasma ixodetis]